MGEEMRKKEAGGVCRPCFVFLGKETKSYFVPSEGTGVYFSEKKRTKRLLFP